MSSPLFFKLVMTAFDFGVMFFLMPMISRQGVPPSKPLFYAANPLVFVYIAGEGHLDVVQVFFLLLALYLILYKKSQFSGFIMLGVAVLSNNFHDNDSVAVMIRLFISDRFLFVNAFLIAFIPFFKLILLIRFNLLILLILK